MAPTFQVVQTKEFKKAVRDFIRSNAAMRDAMSAKMREITRDPLLGSPKTGQLVGYRELHFPRHWVLTWRLIPTVNDRAHKDKIKTFVWAYFDRHEE